MVRNIFNIIQDTGIGIYIISYSSAARGGLGTYWFTDLLTEALDERNMQPKSKYKQRAAGRDDAYE